MSGLGVFTSIMGVLSVTIAVLGMFPYWKSIIGGRTKPHQFSWIIFAIMNVIITVSQFLEGGRSSVLISLAFAIGCVVNVILSFRYGTRGTSRFDVLLFGLALTTIAAWTITESNAVAIWLTVVIDVLATAMIVLKIAAEPDSEDPFPWAIATIAFAFSCASLIGTSNEILYVRPVYGLLSDVVVIAAIFGFRAVVTKTSSPIPLLSINPDVYAPGNGNDDRRNV